MKSLKIQNLILIEEANIYFRKGLNILTGETGAGKSAILSAIRLISGRKADSQMIRKGSDFAIVEALLEDGTHVRREIYRSGKNRCFIDDAQVSLAELKELASIEMIDQSSSESLFEEERKILDAFAGISTLVDFSEEKRLQAQIEDLLKIPKARELEWAQKDLFQIVDLNWKEGEDEKLTEEHHLLCHSKTLAEKIGQILSLDLHSLKKGAILLEQCARLDPTLSSSLSSMKSASLEFEEIHRNLSSYLSKLEADPHRLSLLEKRLSDFEALKRRFGPNLTLEKEKIEKKIESLFSLDQEIEELKKRLKQVEIENRALADQITHKRKEAALTFGPLILKELKSLNIPHAQFEILVSDTYNEVHFLFSANPGISPLPLEKCASGGELSRLLLAIKTLLSQGSSCIVFDEIDSNVGGQTAAILGEKLKKLAEKRQVICVTHFVQVAKCAMGHLLVSKIEKEGQAFTTIIELDEKSKEKEYKRMLGTKL